MIQRILKLLLDHLLVHAVMKLMMGLQRSLMMHLSLCSHSGGNLILTCGVVCLSLYKSVELEKTTWMCHGPGKRHKGTSHLQ